MALTTPHAFIRFVSCYHEKDYQRMDEWAERLKQWKNNGIESIYFFMHQDMEKDFPFLSTYLVEKFNQVLGTQLPIPAFPKGKSNTNGQTQLF